MSAERAVGLVESRLSKFNISLENDIAATITDGASLMMKVGRITSPIHVPCWAHAIHLGVCDVLYQRNSSNLIVSGTDAGDDENDDDETLAVVVPEFSHVVDKVRKIVRLFRKSPVRNNDNLQPQIVSAHRTVCY